MPRRKKISFQSLKSSSLNGLSGYKSLAGLGDIMPHTKMQIENNKQFFEQQLKCCSSLSGSSDVLSFKEAVEVYNKGIDENSIKAWVYYKIKQGLPMTYWKKYYKVTDSDMPALVKAGAMYVFEDEFLPLPVYAYGDMYEREEQLIKDKDRIIRTYGNAVYEKHVKVIEENRPKQLRIDDADPAERPIIQIVSKIARDIDMFSIKTVKAEYFDVEKADQLTKQGGRIVAKKGGKYAPINLKFDGIAEYTLRDVFVKYLYTLDRSEFKKTNAIDVAEYYVYNKSLVDPDMSEAEKTEIKSNARDEGEVLFQKFLFEVLTPEDQQKLSYTWNKLYNAYSDIKHNIVPVGFEISRKFKSGTLQLTPIQREGVAFFNLAGSGINAFDVGVGKTMTAIVALANAMYSGQCSRPLIVVPKPTYRKWIREIVGYEDSRTGKHIAGVLSGTGITINEFGNLGTKVKYSNKKVDPMTITVVTYEGFKKLGFSENVGEDMITELTNILGQSKNTDISARDKELDQKKIEGMIGYAQKDSVADIDTLGFDYICIDEAHRCKNVFNSAKSDDEGNTRYKMTGSQSVTGVKAFFVCNYIQRTYGRNVMLLTATPFTNSPLEIYSMLSLVAHKELVSKGLLNLVSFFDMFIQPTKEWSANYKGEIQEKEVVKSFINRIVLQKIIHNHIIYRTGKEANVKRPVKINLPRLYEETPQGFKKLDSKNQVLTYLKPTPLQEANQDRIYSKAKNATKGQLNMKDLFQALNESLDNALSPFLYSGTPDNYKEFVEESPKILFTCEAIKTVKQWHEKQPDSAPEIIKQTSGQIIYSNRGKRFFPLIKQYLENEVGYEKNVTMEYEEDGRKKRLLFDEVEIIESEMTEDRKENVKEAFLSGIVKVLIGTATIREGIDLQRRGTVLYDLYPEWNPTDLQQLEGRIYRQGNEFAFVRIVLPLVQNTMDVFVFQKLEEKTARINDIWYKADRGNVLPIEAMDPQELKLALITDIGQIAKIYFSTEKEELEREFTRIKRNLSNIDNITYVIQNYKKEKENALAYLSNSGLNAIKGSEYLKSEKEYLDDKLQSWDYRSLTDAEKQKKIPELVKEYKAKNKKFTEMLQNFSLWLNNSDKTDSEIIENGRMLTRNFDYIHGNWAIDRFRTAMTEAFKVERTVLKPKKLNLNSDLSNLKFEYEKEQNDILNIAERYKGEVPERLTEIMEDVRKRKALLNIDGKTAEERSKEFADLNYLLSYLKDDFDPDTCTFPTKTEKPGSCVKTKPNIDADAEKAKRIRIAKVKAIAKLKMLKLLSV